jgi:hypothetical protein
VSLGCRVHQTVTTTARVILVVMAPWVGNVGAVSSPLAHSCGGIGVADVQEPGVEEPSGGEPYVEEPSHSRCGLARSSVGWRLEWRW